MYNTTFWNSIVVDVAGGSELKVDRRLRTASENAWLCRTVLNKISLIFQCSMCIHGSHMVTDINSLLYHIHAGKKLLLQHLDLDCVSDCPNTMDKLITLSLYTYIHARQCIQDTFYSILFRHEDTKINAESVLISGNLEK